MKTAEYNLRPTFVGIGGTSLKFIACQHVERGNVENDDNDLDQSKLMTSKLINTITVTNQEYLIIKVNKNFRSLNSFKTEAVII